MRHRTRAAIVAILLAGLSAAPTAPAQTSREAEQKLQRVRSELKSIAQERRKLESERGAGFGSRIHGLCPFDCDVGGRGIQNPGC